MASATSSDGASADRAWERALSLLAGRARSRAEVEERLRRAGFDAGVVSQVVARLTRQGWLNDAEFAVAWAARRLKQSPMGRKKLAAELQRFGLAPAIIEHVLEQELPPARERELAAVLAEKYRRRQAGASQAQLGRYLWQRGFGAGLIAEIVKIES